MKKPVQKLGKLTILFLSIFLIAAACSKDDTPETKTPPPPTDNPDGTVQDSVPESTETLSVDPNQVTKSLKFRNARIINGDFPTGKSAKTTMVDLKIDTDTIFWVEGVTSRIKLLKPEGLTGFVGTFWAQVEGSDSYIEAEFEKEQENDTIVFLNFDFDVTEWDPPFSFNMKFVPSSDIGTEPIIVIEKPVVIEKLFGNGACTIIDASYWEWIYTNINGELHTAPMMAVAFQGTIKGCCTNGRSYSGAECEDPTNPDQEFLDYETSYAVSRDFFKFNISSVPNSILGRMRENANNLDPLNTDFCGGLVSYTDSNIANYFSADVTQSNCTFTLDNMFGEEEEVFTENGTSLGFLPLPIYMGSGSTVEYRFLSPHFISETRKNADSGPEGSSIERVYWRRSSERAFNENWWY